MGDGRTYEYVVALRSEDGEIRAETTLSAAQTKGNKALTIWFAEKARVELAAYKATHKSKTSTQPLFYAQRSDGFTAEYADTRCQQHLQRRRHEWRNVVQRLTNRTYKLSRTRRWTACANCIGRT